MKFLDSFGYFVMAILLLVIGYIIGDGVVWTLAMNGVLVWFCQALALALALVGITCLVSNKRVKELTPGAVTWIMVLVTAISLVGIVWMDVYNPNTNATITALIELGLFFVILLSLFLLPRKHGR
jgi:hypothetical protein